jgi:hypothetical protein
MSHLALGALLAALGTGAPPASSDARGPSTTCAPPEGEAVSLAVVPTNFGAASRRSLFDALREVAEGYPRVRVVGFDALFLDGVEPIGERALACGSDLACVTRTLRGAGHAWALLVTENHRISPPLRTLELIALERGAVCARKLGEAGSETRASAVRAALESLGLRRGGWLAVEVTPPSAVVRVEGRPPRVGSARYFLEAGRVAVAADAEGHRSARVRARVRPGEATTAHIVLEPEAEALWSSPWFWGAVGVAAVGAAAAGLAASGAFADTEPGCFCVRSPASPPCPPCP